MVNNESVVLAIFTFEVLEWTCFSEHWCCKQSIAVCYLWIKLSALVGRCFGYCSLLYHLGALVAAAGLLFFPRGILCISRACLQGQDLWGSAFLVVYISIWVLRCWDGRRTRSSRRDHCRALVYVWEQVGGSWVSFAALIAVVHRCLQVNTFALLSFIAFVCQLFPSTCQQMLSHQSCSFQPFPLSPS